jgi:sRNA-binding carbon storage regulator CsrA
MNFGIPPRAQATRTVSQTLRIGSGVLLTVLDVDGPRAKVRFMTTLTVWTQHGELQETRNGEKTLECRSRDSVRIGEHIFVSIVRVKGHGVVFSVAAPSYLSIDRQERYLWERHLTARFEAH